MPSVTFWQDRLVEPLRALKRGIVKNKILVLAVLAPLIPALATTCVFYSQNRRLLSDQIDQELRRASSEAAREVDDWLAGRLAELRTAASSYLVSENLAKIPGRESVQAVARLRDYLNSVRERFPDQEGLVVIDPAGRAVDRARRADPPVRWAIPGRLRREGRAPRRRRCARAARPG